MPSGIILGSGIKNRKVIYIMENIGNPIFWHGYLRKDFKVNDRDCIVVIPERPAPGMPWIWRARFWDVEPQTEIALLDMGFHVAYIDCVNFYGSPSAMEIWDAFYEYLTMNHGLSPKPALMGLSRGGLFIYNWAARNPEKVSCVYADAPVCDIKSWPAGKGKVPGNPVDWKNCQTAYGLSEEELLAWDKNPVDTIQILAAAKVPLLSICGDEDEAVPVEENSDIMFRKCGELGGNITMFVKKGCKHHPHSLRDPGLIVSFILKYTVDPGMEWVPQSYAGKEVYGGTCCGQSIMNKKYMLELR